MVRFLRDDYALIESHAIKRYETPEIVEVCCFIDLKICYDRFVNAFAWHPTLSGVFVASYTYKTINVLAQGKPTHFPNAAEIKLSYFRSKIDYGRNK